MNIGIQFSSSYYFFIMKKAYFMYSTTALFSSWNPWFYKFSVTYTKHIYYIYIYVYIVYMLLIVIFYKKMYLFMKYVTVFITLFNLIIMSIKSYVKITMYENRWLIVLLPDFMYLIVKWNIHYKWNKNKLVIFIVICRKWLKITDNISDNID